MSKKRKNTLEGLWELVRPRKRYKHQRETKGRYEARRKKLGL